MASGGIFCATKFCGDGSCLTGISAGGFTPDAQQNLYAGTNAGAASDADTCCNIAIGISAFASNTSGDNNIFLGNYAGCKTTNAIVYNIGIGYSALTCPTSNHNIAIGFYAGKNHGQADNNTLLGSYAGCSITYGGSNVMLGRFSGRANTGGNNNFFGGYGAGCCNLTGNANVAIGNRALASTGSGSKDSSFNIALGYNALREIHGGGCNFAVGREAGVALGDGVDNILIGRCSDAGGSSQNRLIMIGWKVRACNSTGSDQLAIGCDTCRWLQGDSSFNLCLGGGQAIKAMANGNFCATAFYGDGSNLTGISGGGSGGCLKLVATRNYVSDGSCSGCNFSGATDNIILGTCAGQDHTSGDKNVFIGCQAGRNSTTGSENVFIGLYAGCGNASSALTGNSNVAIGCKAGCGLSSGGGNTLLGYRAAPQLTTGGDNTIIGLAGYNMTTQSHNFVVGYAAGSNISNHYNIALGPYAGQCLNEHSIAMGWAGGYKQTGSRNIFIGADTACRTAGSGNYNTTAVSYTHLRAHETSLHLVCRLLLEKKKKKHHIIN